MAVLLPFRAFRSRTPISYIPGEESQSLPVASHYIQDAQAALYLYRQTFRFAGENDTWIRYGIMGLLNRDGAQVLPHEETFPDRVSACAQSLSLPATEPGSLWLWCDDSSSALASLLQESRTAEIEITDRFGCLHQIWPVTDAGRIRCIQNELNDATLFLADGHHRFAAGWNLATIQIRSPALRPARRSGLFTLDQIERNARRGILLPPKSTDFHPKLAAGLVVHRR